jgi:polyribonucleotide nucleotidyltransferase
MENDTQNKKYSLKLGNTELSVEINALAEQANGAALVRFGDTMILATAVMSKTEKENMGFFPLMVDYEEKYYAAGKIKGPRFIKRETRPSDEAICNARLIDRTIRPLFPEGFRREVQTVVTVLSWDAQNEPDILGLFGTSMALAVSDIPWKGPTVGVRVAIIDGQYILNPTYEQREKSTIDVVFSGIIRDGETIINMIEGGFKEVGEEVILKAYDFAKPFINQLLEFQMGIIRERGKAKEVLPKPEIDSELEKFIKDFVGNSLEAALYQKDKLTRAEALKNVEDTLEKSLIEKFPGDESKVLYASDYLEKEIERLLHENVMKHDRRPDGRELNQVREISGRVGLIPRTHGSAFFTRGETKCLSILTLGAPGDSQLIEQMEVAGKKRFLHHYNFPPYSVGEVKPMRGPGRREIGHGMLAEKTLLSLIPPVEEFPYTIRVVSEILSSNGSTSQAALSAAAMSLMDAGVPIKSLATGISLGLITEGKNYKILTDIQGPEDHYGDMDFKVAGTKTGVTAIQMDVKIDGINEQILKDALQRGKEARLFILAEMEKVIAAPRPELSQYAPRILTLQINPDKIRDVIGPGGKMINEIIAQCGVMIDIEDDGKVFVTAEKEESGRKAVEWIQSLTREVKVGEVFQGTVKRIMNFGAFVEILPNQEGMVHISKLANRRVEKVEDIVKLGDVIPVKVIGIDELGRIDLSLKDAQKEPKDQV